MARAAGAKSGDHGPGLSPPSEPRDPERSNRFANAAIAVGALAVFVDAFAVPTVVAIVFAVLGLRRSRAIDARGKGRVGRRRCLWAVGLALFGLLQLLYGVFVRPLF